MSFGVFAYLFNFFNLLTCLTIEFVFFKPNIECYKSMTNSKGTLIRYENRWGGFFDGEFVDGELSGHNCREVNEIGELVDGEWQDGMLHGKGRFSSPKEGEMKGFWHYGEMIGFGCQKYPCGSQ